MHIPRRCWNTFIEIVGTCLLAGAFVAVMFVPLIVLPLVGIELSLWARVAVFGVWQGLLLIVRLRMRPLHEVRCLRHLYKIPEAK